MQPGTVPTTLLNALADGSCRTMDELDGCVDLTRRQISDGAGSLIMRGLLERVEVGCYRLTPNGQQAAMEGRIISSGPYRPDRGRCRAAQPNTLRQRAWNAMRMSGAFTIGDLVMAAACGVEKDPEGNLRRYLKALVNAGYLVELPVRAASSKLTSNGFKRFRLVRDTGPVAPVWRHRSKGLFDHNLGDSGEIVLCP
ncbi:conserved hypothetical protein [Roseibium sp. TrichSKD4]|uniref:hypothetical protein n=1 Tax=Roseibium sp. TrichSKD4 TaxID=744980 RepID=UPI0001E56934|nr:hypothetical protein [Roseibium sp. TrichSKD4]EFO32468.1 conserved hypothetical protein [Roseibium sp. TrichSKD4]